VKRRIAPIVAFSRTGYGEKVGTMPRISKAESTLDPGISGDFLYRPKPASVCEERAADWGR